MRKLIITILLIVTPVLVFAERHMIWDKEADDLLVNDDGSINVEVDSTRSDFSFNQARTTNGLTLYMSGNDSALVSPVTTYVNGSTHPVITIYNKPAGDHTNATYQVFDTYLEFKTTNGLYPGTTIWDFTDAAQDTITEALVYWNAKSTFIPGIEGGIIISTTIASYGANSSTLLSVMSSAVDVLDSSSTVALTPTATYQVFVSSVKFVSAGGLYAGTTHWIFSKTEQDTLAEACNYWTAKATTTAGIEGGIVLSTAAAYYGVILSTTLTTTSVAATHFQSDNTATLTVTPVASPTARYAVYDSSMALITTNGLYPGTTHFVFSESPVDTQAELISHMNNIAAYTPGIDGTVTAARVQGSYGENLTTQLTEVASTNCKAVTNQATLAYDSILGISYILPGSSLTSGESYYVTDFVSRTTFADGGTTTVSAYDGISSTNTRLAGPATVGTTNVSDEFYINSYIYGSADTDMRWDVVSSSPITGTSSYIDIRGFSK